MRMHSAFTTNPIAFSIIRCGGCVVRVSAIKLVGCGSLLTLFSSFFFDALSSTLQKQVKAVLYRPRSPRQCIKAVYVAVE